MSAPNKKTKKTPESYTPHKPEIVNMMNEAENGIIQQTITESGLINFSIEKRGPYRFVGRSLYMGNKIAPKEEKREVFNMLWAQSDWVFEALDRMKEYASDEPHNARLVVWDKYDDKNELFGYYIGRFMKADTPITKEIEFDYYDIPEGYVANAWRIREADERLGPFVEGADIFYDEIKQAGKFVAAHWDWSAGTYPTPDGNGSVLVGYYCACVPTTEQETAQ